MEKSFLEYKTKITRKKNSNFAPAMKSRERERWEHHRVVMVVHILWVVDLIRHLELHHTHKHLTCVPDIISKQKFSKKCILSSYSSGSHEWRICNNNLMAMMMIIDVNIWWLYIFLCSLHLLLMNENPLFGVCQNYASLLHLTQFKVNAFFFFFLGMFYVLYSLYGI